MLRTLLLLPLLFISCGSVFQGPVFGRIALDRPADAGDAVAFLRCRGGGIHGEIQTDAEDTRVAPSGRFSFAGSLTFPTTERCYLELRHPRYQTVRVALDDVLVQKLAPIVLTSWDQLFAAGPGREPVYTTPWPQTEVYRHLMDTLMWLRSFPENEQHNMARYVPDIHAIYRQAYRRLEPQNSRLRDMLRLIGMIEELTDYPYPFNAYLEAVRAGDAQRVQAFIRGGVLRETNYRGQSSVLSLAAAEGHLEVIDVLLANDEPLNIPGCGSALLGAIREAQWPAALVLLKRGADPDLRCDKRRVMGDTLVRFSRSENLELLTAFLEAGVPVDTPDSRGTTALAEAVSGGHIQSVKLLLAAGADPGTKSTDGGRLADVAASRGYLDIKRELQGASAAAREVRVPEEPAGELLSLPWRRGFATPYRIHSNYGQVNSFVADPKRPGVLWLATWGGLLRIEPESGEQRVWSRVHGLPVGQVKDLWFDPGGRYLWLATPAGLARLPLNDLDRVETIGSGEPRSSYASGFLPGQGENDVWYWESTGLYRLHPEDSEARRFTFPRSPAGMVALPGGSGFFISDNRALWRLDTTTGRREMSVSADTLARQARNLPPGTPEPRSLALDEDARTLWMGSQGHGVFRLDIDSGAVSRLALTREQIARCARNSASEHMHGAVIAAGGRIFAQLERCFGRIDDNNRLLVLRERIDAGPVADAAGTIWLLAENRFHRLDGNDDSVEFPRPPDPLGNSRVSATHREGNRLFVGVQDAPLAVLDLEKRTWSQVPRATNIRRLRRVAGRDELLAMGQARYYWVDSGTLAVREFMLGPANMAHLHGTQWRDLRDMEFDGETLWVLRDNRQRGAGKARRGLYRLQMEGAKRYDSASGYSLGELAAVVQDPSDAQRLWLLRKGDRTLIDFDKASGDSELIGANRSRRNESELLASALENPRLKALTTGPHETLDPDSPGLTWGVQGGGVYLKRGPKILQRWPARLPTGPVEIVRDTQTTVWIASAEGLVEFPIAESLAELLQADPVRTNSPVGTEKGVKR